MRATAANTQYRRSVLVGDDVAPRDVDVDTLKDKALRDLAKWIEEVDPALARAEDAVAAGRRLLTKSNLQQLHSFLSSKADKQAFSTYLDGLPSGTEALSNAA